MPSTCFEPEISPSGRRLCMQSSTHKTAYTDACKTYRTVIVYIAVFLKMNSRVRNIKTGVSQPPARCPVPGPGIKYTGPREVLLEFVILIF